MTLLYLVRHGETDWNLTGRIQGSTDIPLNETGREQARATGRLLARRAWDAVVASPLARASETAAIIANHVGIPTVEYLEEIAERNYGAAEGLTFDEVERLYPREAVVPGRETRDNVVARAMPALLSLADAHRDESLIVVSHGGVIRAVLNEVTSAHGTQSIRNGSIHSFRHADGDLQLIAFDDPIDLESLSFGTEELEQQNEIERRESAGASGATSSRPSP